MCIYITLQSDCQVLFGHYILGRLSKEAAVLIDLAIFIESIIAKTSYARITAIDSTKLNFIYETKSLFIDYPLSSCPIDDRGEYHHI
ncbi:hypothetical protein AVI56_04240 [Piscirickettsia salmonis]|nr:hypothetical protein AVI56_04240 [Piscirickettsia salmonis]